MAVGEPDIKRVKEGNMIEIIVNCKGTHYLPLDKLHVLQDTDKFKLKELSTDNFEKLRKRIEKRGFWFPLFVWHCLKEKRWYYTDGTQRHKVLTWMKEATDLDGNPRYKLPDKFPCVEIFAKDKKQAAEAILSQSASYGTMTEEGLAGFLDAYDLTVDFPELKTELDLPDIDLDSFSIDTPPPGEGNEDDVPEPPPEPKTKPGDLYKLGNHRVLCGDSTNKADVDRLMDGKKADMVFTDPPYNVGINYGKNTNDKNKDYESWCIKWFKLLPADLLVFTCGMVNLKMWYRITDPKWLCSWRKTNQCSRSAIGGFNTWEPLLVYGKHIKNVGHDSWDITVKHDQRSVSHPVQKTVEAWQTFVEAFTDKGHLICDSFLGSGTTLIACEKTGRTCYGMELEPGYVDVIVKRWEDYTGKEAELVGNMCHR